MKTSSRILTLLLVCICLLSQIGSAIGENDTINWLGYYTSDITVAADSFVEKTLEEYFNVDINPITDVSKSNFGLYVSSMGVLDATFYTVYLDSATNIYDMYNQDLIREIPVEWLETYYPTGMKYLRDFAGNEYFDSGKHLVKGLLLNIPYTRTENNSQSMIVYRKDWLDKLGLKEPTTLDEFHDMLYAFTFSDPDGNGQQDTYGLDASTAWLGYTMVFGAYGIAQSQGGKCGTFTLNKDGTVTYSSVTEAYKEALKVIRSWYDEGIIDPECITDVRADIRTKWSNGTIGAMVDSFTWCLSKRGSASIIGMVEDVYGPDIVGVIGKMTCNTGDGTVYSSKNYITTNVNQSICFTASATDEQVIKVLQILEGISKDDELHLKVTFGEENIDYTMNGQQLVVNSDVNVEYQASKGLDTFYDIAIASPFITYVSYSDRDHANLEKVESTPAIFRDTNFTRPSSEEYDQYFEEVKKVEGEYYTDVLLGRKDVDSTWNEYISSMNKAGLDKILTDYARLLAE